MRKRFLMLAALLCGLIAYIAYAHTTTTTISRSQLDHPDLGYEGGATLHSAMEAIYNKLGNNANARYQTFTSVAVDTTSTYEHNLGVAFEELRTYIFTGPTGNLVRVSDPAGDGWTVEANGSNPKTHIDVTTPSAGGPFTFALVVVLGTIDLEDDVTGQLPVASGGTGAADAATAADNLGVGSSDAATFASATLSGPTGAGFLELKDQGGSEPSSPASSGDLRLFAADDQVKYKDASGVVKNVGSGAGGSAGINLLAEENYNFESGNTKWTASVPSNFTVTTTAADVYWGTYSGVWDADAVSETLVSESVAVPAGLEGKQCVLQFQYKGGDSDILYMVHDGSGVVDSSSKSITASTEWVTASTFFKCPSQGTTIFVRIHAGSDTAALYLDEVHMGTKDLISIPDPRWPSYDESYYSLTLYNNAGALNSDTGILRPFQDADGDWFLDVDIELGLSGSSDSSFEILISGIDVSTSQAEYHIGNIGTASDYTNAYVSSTDDKIYIRNGTASFGHKIQGRIPLASKPTWATKTAPDVYLAGSVNVDDVTASASGITEQIFNTSESAIKFNSSDIDTLNGFTHNAFTINQKGTDDGTKYVIQADGKYYVDIVLRVDRNGEAWTTGSVVDCKILINQSTTKMVSWVSQGTDSSSITLQVSGFFSLVEGDEIQVTLDASVSTTRAVTDTLYSKFDVFKIPSPQEVANAALTFSTATADRPGLVPSYSYEELDISSSGDFSAAQPVLRIARIGSVVTLTWPDLAHTSGVSATSSGFLASAFRPNHDVYNTYIASSTGTRMIRVQSDGTITFYYFDAAGTAASQSATSRGSISWVVDE